MALLVDLNQFTPKSSPQFNRTVEEVYQSIINILLTPKGTKFFDPEFGSSPGDLLFELNNDLAIFQFKSRLIADIEESEPRVKLSIDAVRTPETIDNNTMNLFFLFKIPSVSDEF